MIALKHTELASYLDGSRLLFRHEVVVSCKLSFLVQLMEFECEYIIHTEFIHTYNYIHIYCTANIVFENRK